MSNQWRTVYKSSNKHIMIKPRNRTQTRNHKSKPMPSEKSPDPLHLLGGLTLLVTGIVIVAEGWPFILIALFIYGIARALK